MRDVVVGHGQNRNLGDGTVPSLNSTSTLVNGGQIGIEITGVTSSTGNFFSCGGDLVVAKGCKKSHSARDDIAHTSRRASA